MAFILGLKYIAAIIDRRENRMFIPALIIFVPMTVNSPQEFRKWGLETIDLIQKELVLPSSGLYGEEAKPGEPPAHPAFTWSVGVMLQALNAAATLDKKYKPLLAKYVDAISVYWNTEGPVPGFDVLPGPKPKDRYYDDNEWVVLGLVSASEILKSPQALDRAKDTFKYVMSGLDTKLGGGIYWRESDKASKNTCSNGPAAAGAIALFEKTGDRSYLQTAEDLYAWTKEHLRDPSDGIYWDNVSLSGHVQNWKFSYNTGMMLRTAAKLFQYTKKEAYAADAREMQASSLKKWTGPDGGFTDDIKFMHLLTENWLWAYKLVPGAEDPRPVLETGLKRLHDVSRDALGHFGNKCNDIPKNGPYSPYKLIDQAAAAQMFLTVAHFE
jgi:rhamnogalacturonyl hydrolase YesR